MSAGPLARHPARKLAAIYAGGVVGALIRVGLALGTAHSCALQSTGNVTCWGSDEHRALGARRL